LPVSFVGASAALCRSSGRLKVSTLAVATRFSYALAPIGFGMWLAHYSFHFLSSMGTAASAFQRFASDLGWTILGQPTWACSCCQPVAYWLPRLEIIFLDLGLLLSLYTGYRIARSQSECLSRTLRILMPWALLIAILFAAGVWIVLQPMQMRGTLSEAG
jgi:hypothetical protein